MLSQMYDEYSGWQSPLLSIGGGCYYQYDCPLNEINAGTVEPKNGSPAGESVSAVSAEIGLAQSNIAIT